MYAILGGKGFGLIGSNVSTNRIRSVGIRGPNGTVRVYGPRAIAGLPGAVAAAPNFMIRLI
jgi:hypothetical protein